MGKALRMVGWYGNDVEAEIAKGRLEEAGVPVVLSHDTGGIHMPWTAIRLLVREEDLERAREILAAPAPPVPPSGAASQER